MNPMLYDVRSKEFLTPQDLKELYNIGIDKQNALRSRKLLPYYKIGNTILYRFDEVKCFIMSYYIPAKYDTRNDTLKS